MTAIFLIFLLTLTSTSLTSDVSNKVKRSFNSELFLTLGEPTTNDKFSTRQLFRRAITSGSTYSEICGLSGISKPLVQNGESVEPGEWPWLAAIFKRTKFGTNFNCGGSLVTSTHVVTAAHCVQLPNRPLDQPSILIIALGKHNIFSIGGEEHSQSRKVSQILVNPQYNKPRSLDNDIAVLVLVSPVYYSEVVRPVCLFSPQDPPSQIIGSKGAVIGWGKTETGDPVSEEPKLVRMPIVSQDVCVLSNQDFAHLISDKTFCAGSRNGSGPCTGDSGGGLFVSEQFGAAGGNRKRFVLRGLVSRSLVLDGDCDLSNYVIFTDVAKFGPWLKQVIPAQHFSANAPTARPPSGSNAQVRPPPVTASRITLVKIGGRDYYFSSELFNKYLNWGNARQFCLSHRMQLATIETPEENRLLHAHAKKISGRYSPWIGGTDAATEGRWIWDATLQPIRYFNWWTYQPDGGAKENCLYMYSDDGKWGDKECEYTKPFICEQED